jgi:hypothetical protein
MPFIMKYSLSTIFIIVAEFDLFWSVMKIGVKGNKHLEPHLEK